MVLKKRSVLWSCAAVALALVCQHEAQAFGFGFGGGEEVDHDHDDHEHADFYEDAWKDYQYARVNKEVLTLECVRGLFSLCSVGTHDGGVGRGDQEGVSQVELEIPSRCAIRSAPFAVSSIGDHSAHFGANTRMVVAIWIHADKNAGNADADDKFHQIARAYEVLSDAQKRQVYDLEGFEGLEREEKGGGHHASPFDAFFGGGGKPKGPDAAVDMPVTLEELYNGAVKEARFARNTICRKCRGTGAKDGKTSTCKTCGGQGIVLVTQRMGPGFNVQMQQQCPKCGGRGKVFKTHCPHCHGHKVVKEEKTLKAEIEKGMPSNHHIVFERESEQRPGMIPGDVIFRLHQVPHKRFRRANDDLHYEMEITLEEALLGYRKEVLHLDNRRVNVVNSDITKPFQVRSIAGEGMPVHNYPSQKGDLHVLHQIKFPKKLTAKQKQLIEELLEE